jgi:HTH-type transcriptional regulator, transcriptional repressor of NAD biosynthesis genes
MNSRTTGLTLGKFAPLHRGHQHVIETALSEVDELIVMIYDCPEVINVSLHARAQWIRDLYPKVEVIEVRGGPTEVGSHPAITRAHDAYILKTLGGRRITHFYSSEFYGEHVSAALGAVDRRVDPARSHIPISATQIRRSPFRHRDWMAPRVYRDLIENIVFLGGPSTGKTTLCEHLASRYSTCWMPEYGREYWATHQLDRRLTPQQLVEITEGHLQREEALLLESNRILFTDTNALTTLLFARYYHGSALQELNDLADLASRRYSRYFLCAADIPYDNTWDRSGEINRQQMQQWTVDELTCRGVPFTVLKGSVEERAATVEAMIGPPVSSEA